jgi:predicted molibdopterin-dependent oxidoreductase YjgC
MAAIGRLGLKGLFGWQANGGPDRLATPLMRVDGELREPAGIPRWMR